MSHQCPQTPVQVAWSSTEDPAKGFQYLYLTDADYSRLASKHSKPVIQVGHSASATVSAFDHRLTSAV